MRYMSVGLYYDPNVIFQAAGVDVRNSLWCRYSYEGSGTPEFSKHLPVVPGRLYAAPHGLQPERRIAASVRPIYINAPKLGYTCFILGCAYLPYTCSTATELHKEGIISNPSSTSVLHCFMWLRCNNGTFPWPALYGPVLSVPPPRGDIPSQIAR